MGSKIYTYVVIITTMMIFFNIAGLVGSNEGVVLGQWQLGTSAGLVSFKDTSFFDYISSNWVTLLATAGVIIGAIAFRGNAYTILSAGIASGILAVFIQDLVTIVTKISSEGGGALGWVALVIGAPLVAGYVIALWEWIGGHD